MRLLLLLEFLPPELLTRLRLQHLETNSLTLSRGNKGKEKLLLNIECLLLSGLLALL